MLRSSSRVIPMVDLADSEIKLGPSLADDFCERRLFEIDDSYRKLSLPAERSSDGNYERDSLSVIEPTHEMMEQAKKFKKAVDRFLESKNGKKTKLSVLDETEGYKYGDVLEELRHMNEEQSAKKHDGFLGKLEGCYRNFHQCQGAVESFLRFLPSESWQGSLFCGGIKFIIGAAARLESVRKDVSEALEQIPITISNVQQIVVLYDQAILRQQHVSKIFVVLLEILEQCLEWFRTHSGIRLAKAMLLNDEYGKKLKDKLNQMRKYETRINDQASLELQRNVKEGFSSTNQEKFANNLLEKMKVMLVDQERLREVEKVNAELKTAADVEREQRRNVEAEKQRLMLEMLEIARTWKDRVARDLPQSSAKMLQDLATCLSLSPTSYAKTTDRAAWILQSSKVLEWLASTKSETLVVNGHEPHHGNGESAVSMFSAMLVRSLAEADSESMVLYWFGGQNIHADALHMARGLLKRLLEDTKVVLAYQDVADIKEDWTSIQTVVELLCRWLRAQLSTTSIYCVLDSASCYEDRRAKDLLVLYNGLQNVARTCGEGHCLKLLVTSPTRCTWIGTSTDLTRPTILTVPDVVDSSRVQMRALPVIHRSQSPLPKSQETGLGGGEKLLHFADVKAKKHGQVVEDAAGAVILEIE